MASKIKRQTKKKSRDPNGPLPTLDKNTIQRAAANALLSLTPATVSAMCKDLDPDLGYELVYAAANQTLQHFEGKGLTGKIRPPTEMAVTVKHDPELLDTEIRYSFTEAKFTIYTPDDLQTTVKSGDRKVTKEEALRNNLSESLPSAQLKLFYNQGLLLAQGDEEAYRNRYLPEQFLATRSQKYTSKKKIKK
jgi:hypothetical protein